MTRFTERDLRFQTGVVDHLTERINELNERLGREQRILSAMTKERH